jgi:arsenate reductase
MISVLFICIHNSARSQIAEAYLNTLAPDRFKAESAGIEAGVLNPLVVKSLGQEGIDISGNKTKSVFDMYKSGRSFDYVITVCDREAAERCPVFTGVTQRLHWFFPDPSRLSGTDEEKLENIAVIKSEIKSRILEWIKTV